MSFWGRIERRLNQESQPTYDQASLDPDFVSLDPPNYGSFKDATFDHLDNIPESLRLKVTRRMRSESDAQEAVNQFRQEIARAISTIEILDAKGLVKAADRLLNSFVKLYVSGKYRKEDFQGCARDLDQIEMFYIGARHKDKSCTSLNEAELGKLKIEVKKCRIDDLLRMTNNRFDLILECSLKDSDKLDVIKAHIEEWLKLYPEAIKLPGADVQELNRIKPILEGINLLVVESQAFLKNPARYFLPIVDEAVRECNRNGFFSIDDGVSLMGSYNQIFEKNKSLRDAYISLNQGGRKVLKECMKEHLKDHFVPDVWCWCISRKSMQYKLIPKCPVTAQDLARWFNEMEEIYFIDDMKEFLQAPVLVPQVKNEEEGKMQEVPLLDPVS
jgi:hypothetical protein